MLFVAAAAGNAVYAPCPQNCTSLSPSLITLVCLNVQFPTLPPIPLSSVLSLATFISLSCPSFYLSYLFNFYIESLPIASVHAVFLCSSCLLFLHREKRIQCGFRLFVFVVFTLWLKSFVEYAKTDRVY